MDVMHGMQLYVRVVQAGSFSAAGRQVGFAPSSIFRHINALEEMLGTRLLNRTSRKLSLTEAGELYARRVENILAAIQDTNAELTQLQSSPRGTLRVHCRVSLGAQHLAPALPDFLASYPELRIDLQLADQPVDLVKENIDVAIMVGKIEDSSMIVRKLAISPRIVCASPSYLRRHAAPERPQDLASHNCLTYHTATAPTWRFLHGQELEEVRVSGSLQSNNAEVVRLGAINGLGIALLPEWSIGLDLAENRLQPLLMDYEATPVGFDTGIYVVTQRLRNRSLKVQLFLDFLVTLFRERRNWRARPINEFDRRAASEVSQTHPYSS